MTGTAHAGGQPETSTRGVSNECKASQLRRLRRRPGFTRPDTESASVRHPLLGTEGGFISAAELASFETAPNLTRQMELIQCPYL